MQQDQPLCLKLGGDEIDAGRVPAGPIETGDEAIFDGRDPPVFPYLLRKSK